MVRRIKDSSCREHLTSLYIDVSRENNCRKRHIYSQFTLDNPFPQRPDHQIFQNVSRETFIFYSLLSCFFLFLLIYSLSYKTGCEKNEKSLLYYKSEGRGRENHYGGEPGRLPCHRRPESPDYRHRSTGKRHHRSWSGENRRRRKHL